MNPKRLRKIALYLKYLAHLIEEEARVTAKGKRDKRLKRKRA